jgi:hypothetical protein
MNDRESMANAELDALGAAYQGGGIGRDAYRQRRRGVIHALRTRNDVTERNPIIADAPARTGAPARNRQPPSPSATPARTARPWQWLVLAATVAMGILAAAWWIWGIRGGVR